MLLDIININNNYTKITYNIVNRGSMIPLVKTKLQLNSVKYTVTNSRLNYIFLTTTGTCF